MKKKVKIIITYFGKFPETMDTFLYSCKNNPEFEWLIFTDDTIENPPANVKIITSTLAVIRTLIEKKLNMKIALKAPYKLCDFRPTFGIIFEEYLMGCDFWGYGDIDLVYGNLSQFITDELLGKYDKIYPCGHLSLIKNEQKYNLAYLKETPDSLDYRTVFSNDKSFIFDEYMGINEKIIASGGKIYGQIEFADMDVVYQRFRTSDLMTIQAVFPKFLFKKSIPRNYINQSFIIQGKRAFRVYLEGKNTIQKQEVAYIHYRHKIGCSIDVNQNNNFYVTKAGIFPLVDVITESEIDSMNPYLGWKAELKEYLKFFKAQLTYKFGKNMRFRNTIRFLKGKQKLS